MNKTDAAACVTDSVPDMTTRVARFVALSPLPIQKDSTIPLPALDLVYARKLLPVLGLDRADTPITSSATLA